MNTKKQMSLPIKIVLGLLIFMVLIALAVAAYFLGGVIFLLLLKRSVLTADWYTLLDAYNSVLPQTPEMKKFKLSIILSIVICFLVPFALIMSGRKKNIDIHGKARFANSKEIDSQGFNGNKGVIIGKLNNQFLRFPGYEFTLLAAPTRSGKGISCVIPNLLTFDDSVVVLDIKAENYNLTSEFRRKHLGQQVFYFNPFNENTHRWNPLSYISKDRNFRVNDLTALATIIYKADPKNPFWTDSARNLFLGLALLVLETPMLPQTIGEILRQSSGKGMPIKDYFEHLIKVRSETELPLSMACLDCLNRFLNNSDDTLKNILSSFSAPLSIWQNPVVDKATCADDFDLRNVRKQRMTVYICITPDKMEIAGFILNMFFSQLINENVKQLPEHNQKLKYQCLMLMDEFTAMGKVSIIAKGVGFMAGYNMRLLIIIQDKSQLESTYGKEDAHNIAANMGVTVFFTPTQIEEAKHYSEMIGYDTVITRNAQHSNVGAMNAGRYSLNETEQQNKRALMLPQELLRMPQTNALIARPGIPMIMGEKIRYYEDNYLKKLFFSVPLQEVILNGTARMVPVPVDLPSPQWTFYYSSIADSQYYLDGDFDDLGITPTELIIEECLAKENHFEDSDDSEDRNKNLETLARNWFNQTVQELEISTEVVH